MFIRECSRDNPKEKNRTRQREKLGWVVVPTKASAHPIGSPGDGMTSRLFLSKAIWDAGYTGRRLDLGKAAFFSGDSPQRGLMAEGRLLAALLAAGRL